MGVIKFFGSGANLVRIASPIEPETRRALLAYKGLPPVDKQFEIDDWVKDVKIAAGLVHGVDNLSSAFDVVYLWGVNNIENARIDFVTGTRKATIAGAGNIVVEAWKGIRSPVHGNSTGMLTGWNINNAVHALPTNHHIHTSFISSLNPSTALVMGLGNYSLVPFQLVGGNLVFRINHSGGLTNFLNDNSMGAYTVKRESNTLVSYIKNDGQRLTGSRTHTGYLDIEYSALGRNRENGNPAAAPSDLVFGSFTGGRGDNVDAALLNEADYKFFLKQGVNLKLYTGGFEI